jgi:hypothetical protein
VRGPDFKSQCHQEKKKEKRHKENKNEREWIFFQHMKYIKLSTQY